MEKYRYSELDWLRVGLILAVFLHHVFMPFNGDGWHVVNKESSKLLDDIMVYFEQLRLQTLFFIAGAGSFILLQRLSITGFIFSKFQRLFVPLIVGMVLIVPPQIYYENINDYNGLLDAYQNLALAFNANHLWFIEFLIIFMLLAIPINYALQSKTAERFIKALARLANLRHGLFSLVVVFIVVRLTLKFAVPSQDHNIENLSISVLFLLFFILGMCFIKNTQIWQAIALHRATNLTWFIISSVLFYGYYFSPDLSPYLSQNVRWQLWWLVCTLVSWSGLLVLVGYASAIFKTTPKWLSSVNELIYPFYILHQTVIVALAFYIVQWQVGIAIKSITLLVSSFTICIVCCYFVIKPMRITRYLFGLKVSQ